MNSIHGVDTLRYVVVHSGLSYTCFTEVLSSYAILYRLSTPNHNLIANVTNLAHIVLYRLSTSNHNRFLLLCCFSVLSYIVFLHQTTTHEGQCPRSLLLSYIVFLHQTTTGDAPKGCIGDCLISSFYIKPQQLFVNVFSSVIVLYRLSTSNHNKRATGINARALSYIVFLHQTTTLD